MNRKLFAIAMICVLAAGMSACGQTAAAAPTGVTVVSEEASATAPTGGTVVSEEASAAAPTGVTVVSEEASATAPTGKTEVSEETADAASTDKTAQTVSREGFSIREISDDLFDRMRSGNTYKENCIVPREDLRYLMVLHKDKDGNVHQGEMVVHKLIAEDVLEIFEKLYDSGYPIERMVLADNYLADDETMMRDNNSSSFNFRFISHTTRISKHGLGMAVDINTLYNPYHKIVTNADGTQEEVIEPATGKDYRTGQRTLTTRLKKVICATGFLLKRASNGEAIGRTDRISSISSCLPRSRKSILKCIQSSSAGNSFPNRLL